MEIDVMDISSAKIQNLIIHKVGNKTREEGIHLSHEAVKRTDAIDSILLRNYLGETIREKEPYVFFHESDISLNAMHAFALELFEDASHFQAVSEKIAKHLYSTSLHPNIAAGDLFILHIDGIKSAETTYQAIGIFKAENKDKFLSINEANGSFYLSENDGINPNLIQKGAIILSGNSGVFAVDRLSSKSKYWFDSFLKVKPRLTEKSIAQSFNKIYKTLVDEVESVEQAQKYKEEMLSLVESREAVSLDDLNEIAGNYVPVDRINDLVQQHFDESQAEIPPELLVSSKKLTPTVKRVASRVRLTPGVELLLSPGMRLQDMAHTEDRNITEFTIRLEREEGQ